MEGSRGVSGAGLVGRTIVLIAIGTVLAFATNLLLGALFQGLSRDFRVALGYVALGVPLLIVEGARPARLGFPRARVGMATVVGAALAAATLLGAAMTGPLPREVSSSLASPLGALTVVAFVEEGLFRGVLQARFITWIGPVRGLTATAGCFTVWHIPQRLLSGTGGADLLISLVIVFLLGLAFGVLMLSVRNAIGPTIWHVAIDLADRL